MSKSQVIQQTALESVSNTDLQSDFNGCFNTYREELISYLVQRFGSVTLANRVALETRARLAESNILLMVGNPRVYLMGYALSLGLQFLQEEGVGKYQQGREGK